MGLAFPAPTPFGPREVPRDPRGVLGGVPGWRFSQIRPHFSDEAQQKWRRGGPKRVLGVVHKLDEN
jgi:hypothetical protein